MPDAHPSSATSFSRTCSCDGKSYSSGSDPDSTNIFLAALPFTCDELELVSLRSTRRLLEGLSDECNIRKDKSEKLHLTFGYRVHNAVRVEPHGLALALLSRFSPYCQTRSPGSQKIQYRPRTVCGTKEGSLNLSTDSISVGRWFATFLPLASVGSTIQEYTVNCPKGAGTGIRLHNAEVRRRRVTLSQRPTICLQPSHGMCI